MIKEIFAGVGGVVFVIGLIRGWAGVSKLVSWNVEERKRAVEAQEAIQTIAQAVVNGKGTVGGLNWIVEQMRRAERYQEHWARPGVKQSIAPVYQVLFRCINATQADLRNVGAEDGTGAVVRGVMFKERA